VCGCRNLKSDIFAYDGHSFLDAIVVEFFCFKHTEQHLLIALTSIEVYLIDTCHIALRRPVTAISRSQTCIQNEIQISISGVTIPPLHLITHLHIY